MYNILAMYYYIAKCIKMVCPFPKHFMLCHLWHLRCILIYPITVISTVLIESLLQVLSWTVLCWLQETHDLCFVYLMIRWGNISKAASAFWAAQNHNPDIFTSVTLLRVSVTNPWMCVIVNKIFSRIREGTSFFNETIAITDCNNW